MAESRPTRLEYTSVGVKDPVIVPDNYLRYNINLLPVNSVAKIQYSITPRKVVNADPSVATWQDWSEGNVSSQTLARLIGAATAIRVEVLEGSDVTLEVNFTS